MVSKKLRSILSILVTFAGFIFSSCQQKKSDSVLAGYVYADDSRWTVSQIAVCFEDPGYEDDKIVIERTVSNAFTTAGFSFIDWSRCTSETIDSIRVRFAAGSSISKTRYIGAGVLNAADGIVLGTVDSTCGENFTGSICQMNNALHEFGHALGLHHEMNRSDNKSCDEFQDDDDSGIQIGDYDRNSIMDYCRLHRANRKGELLSPSEQDIETIKSVNSGPIARIPQFDHESLDRETIALQVAGPNVSQYRFQIGLSDDLNCKDASAYSDPLSVGQIISSNNFLNISDGQIARICLLGADSNGVWQSLLAYSSYEIGIKNPNDNDSPQLRSIRVYNDPMDTNLLVAEAQFDDDSQISFMNVEFSYADVDYTLSKGVSRFLGADRNGSARVKFPKAFFTANGSVYISSVSVADLNGNLASFSAENYDFLLGGKVLSPVLRIVDGKDFELDPPVIESLSIEDINYALGDKHLSILMKGYDRSGLRRVRVKLLNALTKKIRLLYADPSAIQDLGGVYRIRFDISKWTVAEVGGWKIQSVTVFDVFDASTALSCSVADSCEAFDNTDILVPTFNFG